MNLKLSNKKIIALGSILILLFMTSLNDFSFANNKNVESDTLYSIEPSTNENIDFTKLTTKYYTKDIMKTYDKDNDITNIEYTIYSNLSDFNARAFSTIYSEKESIYGYGNSSSINLSFNFKQYNKEEVLCIYIIEGNTYEVTFDNVDAMYSTLSKLCVK